MGFFSGTQQTIAEGFTVRFEPLVHFEFVSEEMRVWAGFGSVVAGGETWTGLGDLGSISDQTFGFNDAAGGVTFQLSGVSPEIVAAARDGDSVRGQPVTVYGQFFGADLQPLDDIFMLNSFIMDVMTYAGMGPTDRRITLTCETVWTTRNSAAFAFFSDRDQQERFAGDLGLERVVMMTGGKRVIWPSF